MSKTSMFDPNSFSEGGGSLAGVVGIVKSALFKWTNWAKEDGSIPLYKKGPNAGQPVRPSSVLELIIITDEGEEKRALISASGVLQPSKDGVTIAKDLEGGFLAHPEGKDVTINKHSGLAVFVESLVNASFDYNLLNENGTTALEGYKLAFEEVTRKDKDGKVPEGAKPNPVVTKVIHGPGTSAKAGKSKPVPAVARPAVGKAKAAPAPEPTEAEEFDAEGTVTEIIQTILGEMSPLPKAKVSMAVNKALAGMGLEQADRLSALKLATDDDFLVAGPWQYDKKSLAAL